MLNMFASPRYPAPSRTESQEPVVLVARSVIAAFLHRRTPSSFSCTSSSSTTTSSCATPSSPQSAEKAPLVPASVKKASTANLNYGSMLKHSRSDSRKAQRKQSISRPFSPDSQWLDHAENVQQQEQEMQTEEMVCSVGSVYSARSWETEGEVSSLGGAFEYDEDRCSIQTFASSERSYSFF